MPREAKIVGHLRYYDHADGIHYVLLFHWDWPEDMVRRTPFRSVVIARHDADGMWRIRVVDLKNRPMTYTLGGLEQAIEQFARIVEAMTENRHTYIDGDQVCQNGWDL